MMVQTKIMTATLWSGKSGAQCRRIMPKSRRRRSLRNRCRRMSRRNRRHTNKSRRRSANAFCNPFRLLSLKDRLNLCRLLRCDKNRRRRLRRRQRRRRTDRGRPLSRRRLTRVRAAALPRSLNTYRWPAKQLKIKSLLL